ncbi:MAG: superoxide dismutase [Gammaproteobacteria bacterium GWE2_42_36]|nr:MAG: superoxide dismutase [Gammaproteobacteria bacterium GWE2_42_36]
MKFELPTLPFAKNALTPYLSAETLEYHYGKHHQTYVTNLNKLITNTEFEQKTLVDIVTSATGAIFNNAAQHWNHTFYWSCLSPTQMPVPEALEKALVQSFASVEKFKEAFTASALGLFGSGWTWLVKDKNGALSIVNTSNAANPMTSGQTPLLTCDVWEHAYYIDYRNARAQYVEAFWKIVNWPFVHQNLMQK